MKKKKKVQPHSAQHTLCILTVPCRAAGSLFASTCRSRPTTALVKEKKLISP
jgi:hypothetical protein